MGNYFDEYNSITRNLVPLAMKKMELDMENEKFNMAKNEAIRKTQQETLLQKEYQNLFTPQTVTEETEFSAPQFTPKTGTIMSIINGGKSLPLGEGLERQTTTRQIMPDIKPVDILKAHLRAGVTPTKDILEMALGNKNFEKLSPEEILINTSTGERVAENTNKNTTQKAFEFDEKYRNLVAMEEQGIPIPPQDKAWMTGYEKQKQQGVPSVTYLPTTNGLVPVVTRGANAGQRVPQTEGLEQMRKPLTEAAAKEFGAIETLKANVKNIKELYDPKYVGPVMGRVYGVGEQLMNLPDRQVRFNSYVNDAKDALLRARSGAQINEQEYARLVKFLPTTELPEKNFEARLQRFQDTLDTMITEKANVYGEQGYDVGSFLAPSSNRPEFKYDVPKGISKWKVGEKTYNIPQDKAEEFFKDNPSAILVK